MRTGGRRDGTVRAPHGLRCARAPTSSLRFVLLAVPRSSGSPPAPARPPPSFDPTGPCTADGSAPGAYPDLEARVPTTYRDAAPETLDSGRNCSAESLGSLADAGFDEVRFAGGDLELRGRARASSSPCSARRASMRGQIADFYADERTVATAGPRSSAESDADHRRSPRPPPRHQDRRAPPDRRQSGRPPTRTWSTSSSPTTCRTRGSPRRSPRSATGESCVDVRRLARLPC